MVGLASQHHELLASGNTIAGLIETTFFERKRLVGAHDDAVPYKLRHCCCLLPRQQHGHFRGAMAAGTGFHDSFVHIRDADLNRNARSFQHGPPGRAARRKYKRLIVAPQRHHPSAGNRRRSTSRAIMAAAVSSIERLVTSISGQLCLAQRRRENAISSATACRSMY